MADAESFPQPALFYRVFVGAGRRSNRPIRRETPPQPMVTTPPSVRMASLCRLGTKQTKKRKRTLCRKFLVSLEERRRTPTSSKSRRRRESRHDALRDGGSSSTDFRKPQHSLRRANYRRYGSRSQHGCSHTVAGAGVPPLVDCRSETA